MLLDPALVLGRWARFFSTFPDVNSEKPRLNIIEGLLKWPVTCALGFEQKKNEIMAALRSMTNARAVGPDELPVELLKLGLNHDPTVILQEFHQVIKLV